MIVTAGRFRWQARALVLAFVLALVLISALLSASDSSAAYAKRLHWERYDVTLDIRQDGTFTVTEDQDISFDEGSFSEGFAVIPLGRIEEISNVQLAEDGRPYQRATSSGQQGTFTVQQFGGEIEILWWFDPASGPETRNFTISYDVSGGLRVYPGVNQIWWRAIDEDFLGDISNSTITINLPSEVTPADLTAGVFTEDYDAEQVQIDQADADTIVFTASDIDQGSAIEPRIEFPPITTATAPAWQQADDDRREREERLEPYRQVANLLFLGAGLLLAVGGPIGAYAVWHSYGRDKPVQIPIDILREPPDDLPPGAVGTLIDEQADIHDLIATMVDLAERGVIQIEETSSEILGITYGRDWKIHRTGSVDGLSPPEKELINALLGTKSEVNLKEIRQSFGRKQKKVRKAFYEELVRRDYFPRNPETVRKWWRIGGFVILGGSAFIGFQIWGRVNSFAPFVIATLIGLGIAAAALIATAGFMPRKTDKGAEAAARWVAFRRYLEQIEQYGDLAEAKEIFARYLPYAVAFGIEKSWVRKFARIDTPAPRWYGSPYGRGWVGRGPVVTGGGVGGGSGDIDMPSMPSLQGMSEGFSGSLQSMSDGLFSMFNQASDSFKPYSSSGSSSGGFGGFSGGGGSFGGGGGGGGRGFR